MTTLGTFWEGLILMLLGIAMAVVSTLYPATDLKTYATLVLGAGWGYITGGAAPNGTAPPTTTKAAAILALMMLALFTLSGCVTASIPCEQGETTQVTTSGQDFSTITQLIGMVTPFVAPAAAAEKSRAGTGTGSGGNSCGTVIIRTTTLGGPLSMTVQNGPTPPLAKAQ